MYHILNAQLITNRSFTEPHDTSLININNIHIFVCIGERVRRNVKPYSPHNLCGSVCVRGHREAAAEGFRDEL